MMLLSVLDAVYPTAASPVDVAVSADDRHTAAVAGDTCTWQ